MKKDLRLIGISIKSNLIYYILPILIIYAVFVPYCIQQIKDITDSYTMELTYFHVSQRYLGIFILWYSWLMIRNYIDSDIKEVLYSLDVYPKIRFVIYSVLLYCLILIPYFIITFSYLTDPIVSVLSLIFLFFELTCLFYVIGFLSRNSLMTVGFLIVFVLLFTQFFILDEPYIVFHMIILAKELPNAYWIWQVLICIFSLGIGLYGENTRKE